MFAQPQLLIPMPCGSQSMGMVISCVYVCLSALRTIKGELSTKTFGRYTVHGMH